MGASDAGRRAHALTGRRSSSSLQFWIFAERIRREKVLLVPFSQLDEFFESYFLGAALTRRFGEDEERLLSKIILLEKKK